MVSSGYLSLALKEWTDSCHLEMLLLPSRSPTRTLSHTTCFLCFLRNFLLPRLPADIMNFSHDLAIKMRRQEDLDQITGAVPNLSPTAISAIYQITNFPSSAKLHTIISCAHKVYIRSYRGLNSQSTYESQKHTSAPTYYFYTITLGLASKLKNIVGRL